MEAIYTQLMTGDRPITQPPRKRLSVKERAAARKRVASIEKKEVSDISVAWVVYSLLALGFMIGMYYYGGLSGLAFGAFLVLYLIGRSVPDVQKSTRTKTKVSKRDNTRWLIDRWALAEKARSRDDYTIFPKWYFDDVTARQIEKLFELEVSFNESEITKGRASDLIGMEYYPDDDDLDIYEFFKLSADDKTQTHARHEIALMFQDGSKAKLWREHRAKERQKSG